MDQQRRVFWDASLLRYVYEDYGNTELFVSQNEISLKAHNRKLATIIIILLFLIAAIIISVIVWRVHPFPQALEDTATKPLEQLTRQTTYLSRQDYGICDFSMFEKQVKGELSFYYSS